jgi:hypothetical protein
MSSVEPPTTTTTSKDEKPSSFSYQPLIPISLLHIIMATKTISSVKKNKEYFLSDMYLRTAFNYGESFVNLYSALFFLFAPSFAAKELAPYLNNKQDDDKVFQHPALRICIRLFGATEILVSLLFFGVLERANATAFLLSVLAGDLAHYFCYLWYTLQRPRLTLSVIAHYLIMTSVLYTKLAYFLALNQ